MALWPCWRAWWSTTRPCTPKSLDANPALSLQDSVVSSFKSGTICLFVSLAVCLTCIALLAGLIKYSELTEYLVRAVTGMQKELQEARCEAGRMSARCASLESEIGQIMGQEEKSRCLQSENERMRRHLCSLQHEVTKLKDEKCDLYMRYTAAIEEKSAVNMRLHDLNLQVSDPYKVCFSPQRLRSTQNEFLLPETQSCDLREKSSKGLKNSNLGIVALWTQPVKTVFCGSGRALCETVTWLE